MQHLLKKNFYTFTSRKKYSLYKNSFKYLKTTHSYHLVDPSPWPALASLSALLGHSGKGRSIICVITELLNWSGGDNVYFMAAYASFEIFMELLSWVVFLLVFLCSSRTRSFVLESIKQFNCLKNSNKILLVSFTLGFAIPNRIYINHGLNSIFYTLLTFIVIFLAKFLPLLNVFIFFSFICAIESLLFAYLYEKNEKFRDFIVYYFFCGNTSFANSYFAYFWGEYEASK